MIEEAQGVIRSEFSFDRRALRIVDVVKDLISTYVDYKSEFLYDLRKSMSRAP